MKSLRFALVALALSSSSALAAPGVDLRVTVSAPSGVHVYQSGRYTVNVANVGTQNASGVVLTINLPRTGTSPQVYLMGTLGAFSAGCSRSGTTLTCSLGSIRKGRSSSAFFDASFPQASSALSFVAAASHSVADGNPTDNTVTHYPVLLNYDAPIVAPRTARVQHCTGTGLTSFYECTLFPSSIAWHEIQLNADNTITFLNSSQGPIDPGFSGTWAQNNNQALSLRYYDTGTLAASFDGLGTVLNTCFEGVTTFPGSTYVSPYQVCLQ